MPKEKKEETVALSVRIDKKVSESIDWIVQTHSNLGKEITRSSWIKDAINSELRRQMG